MINRKGKALLRRKCRPCSPIEKWLVKTHEKMCSMLQHPTSLWLPAVHLLASTDLRHFSDFGALGLGGQRWLGLVVAGSLQGSACAAKISSKKKHGISRGGLFLTHEPSWEEVMDLWTAFWRDGWLVWHSRLSMVIFQHLKAVEDPPTDSASGSRRACCAVKIHLDPYT